MISFSPFFLLPDAGSFRPLFKSSKRVAPRESINGYPVSSIFTSHRLQSDERATALTNGQSGAVSLFITGALRPSPHRHCSKASQNRKKKKKHETSWAVKANKPTRLTCGIGAPLTRSREGEIDHVDCHALCLLPLDLITRQRQAMNSWRAAAEGESELVSLQQHRCCPLISTALSMLRIMLHNNFSSVLCLDSV